MAFVSTKCFVASLQKRRNSSPSRIQNSVALESYQVIKVRSKELPFGKNDGMLCSSHSTVTSFDTICSLQQKQPRPSKLPPIETIATETKKNKGQFSRKKASFRKKSSKVHAQNTQEVVDAQGTSKIQSRKSLQRKRQVKADGYTFLEEDENIYRNIKGTKESRFSITLSGNIKFSTPRLNITLTYFTANAKAPCSFEFSSFAQG